jgi:hypothetical protein
MTTITLCPAFNSETVESSEATPLQLYDAWDAWRNEKARVGYKYGKSDALTRIANEANKQIRRIRKELRMRKLPMDRLLWEERKMQHTQAGFRVEPVKSGQRNEHGDRQYIYKISYLEGPQPRDSSEVLAYCMEHVKPSYWPSEMPNSASPELRFFYSDPESEAWIYHVQEAE